MLSVAAKEDGIVLLPAVLLYELVVAEESLRVALRPRFLVLAAIAAVYLAVRFTVAPDQGFTYFGDESAYVRVATVIGVLGLYGRLLLVPFPLCPFYEWSILPPARSH